MGHQAPIHVACAMTIHTNVTVSIGQQRSTPTNTATAQFTNMATREERTITHAAITVEKVGRKPANVMPLHTTVAAVITTIVANVEKISI